MLATSRHLLAKFTCTQICPVSTECCRPEIPEISHSSRTSLAPLWTLKLLPENCTAEQVHSAATARRRQCPPALQRERARAHWALAERCCADQRPLPVQWRSVGTEGAANKINTQRLQQVLLLTCTEQSKLLEPAATSCALTGLDLAMPQWDGMVFVLREEANSPLFDLPQRTSSLFLPRRQCPCSRKSLKQ